MTKSAEAFRTISEVADALETPAHVLRFWESRFSQVKPVKRAGGRRYYRPSDVALLGGIRKLLHDDGLTIRGVQKILREKGVRHVSDFGDASDLTPAATPAPASQTASEVDLAPSMTGDAGQTGGLALSAARENDVASHAAMVEPEDNRDRTPQTRPDPATASPSAYTPLPASAPGVEARASLQRQREAQIPTSHRDTPLAEGATIPAAALLRAMTAFHANQRRQELQSIYKRLTDLYGRRQALGHSSDI